MNGSQPQEGVNGPEPGNDVMGSPVGSTVPSSSSTGRREMAELVRLTARIFTDEQLSQIETAARAGRLTFGLYQVPGMDICCPVELIYPEASRDRWLSRDELRFVDGFDDMCQIRAVARGIDPQSRLHHDPELTAIATEVMLAIIAAVRESQAGS